MQSVKLYLWGGIAALVALAFFPAAGRAVVCSGNHGTAPNCWEWVCIADTWELQPRDTGTACTDGNACTWGDACDGAGHCRGTAVSCDPAGPCETSVCNGTATCTVAKVAAGAVCPASTNPCEAVCDGQSAQCQPQ